MPLGDPNIHPSEATARPVIRQLDDAAINRIAAGEVVERPASAVKELVENALDAGAGRIEVTYADGGKTLIRVSDDGCGMTAEELPLALRRHATSKIDGSDLLNIHSFGFRGEALPSLGAVGRLTSTSRATGHEAGAITVAGGQMGGVTPAALNAGTVVELRDLFQATPARLKFLRTDRAEAQAIADTVRRLALAAPQTGFTLTDHTADPPRQMFRADPATGTPEEALRHRARAVLGRDFDANAIEIDAEREGIRLSGLAALPTFSRGAAVAAHVFVNARPVRDKQLLGALRAGYADLLPRDRHPAAALFVTLDPQRVDVNVHPAKAEVRFRDPGLVRGLIVSALRHALAERGHRTSSTLGAQALGAFRPETQQETGARIYQMDRPRSATRPAFPGFHDAPEAFAARVEPEPAAVDGSALAAGPDEAATLPLGVARAQIHETFIVAQTGEGMVLVDAHAAHERITYERLKAQARARAVPRQALLIPEVVEMSQPDCDRVL